MRPPTSKRRRCWRCRLSRFVSSSTEYVAKKAATQNAWRSIVSFAISSQYTRRKRTPRERDGYGRHNHEDRTPNAPHKTEHVRHVRSPEHEHTERPHKGVFVLFVRCAFLFILARQQGQPCSAMLHRISARLSKIVQKRGRNRDCRVIVNRSHRAISKNFRDNSLHRFIR